MHVNPTHKVVHFAVTFCSYILSKMETRNVRTIQCPCSFGCNFEVSLEDIRNALQPKDFTAFLDLLCRQHLYRQQDV